MAWRFGRVATLALAAGLTPWTSILGAEAENTLNPALTKGLSRAELSRTLQRLPGFDNTGRKVRFADYRWQVGLRIIDGEERRCGGVLISRRYILTAAHCLDGAAADTPHAIRLGHDQISVFHGSDRFGEGQPLALDPTWPVTFHPNWKATGQRFAWDAAILKLAAPLTTGAPAPLRATSFNSGQAVTSGWGDFDGSGVPSEILRAVKLPVVDNTICRQTLPAAAAEHVGDFTLCTVSQTDDACGRDSGGPLVIGSARRPQTVGIVSWGLSDTCGPTRDTVALVGLYTRASAIAGWVRQVTGDAEAVTSRAPEDLFAIHPIPDLFPTL